MRVSNEFYRHDPKFCVICLGTGLGTTGYRPHTLNNNCWCTANTETGEITCREARKWKVEEDENSGYWPAHLAKRITGS